MPRLISLYTLGETYCSYLSHLIRIPTFSMLAHEVQLHCWPVNVCLFVCVCVGVYLSSVETQMFQSAAGRRGQCTVGRCDVGGNARRAWLTACDSLQRRRRHRRKTGRLNSHTSILRCISPRPSAHRYANIVVLLS